MLIYAALFLNVMVTFDTILLFISLIFTIPSYPNLLARSVFMCPIVFTSLHILEIFMKYLILHLRNDFSFFGAVMKTSEKFFTAKYSTCFISTCAKIVHTKMYIFLYKYIYHAYK